MILLDTNVVSELMRRDPEPAVRAWLDAQPSESLWTTSITVFEIRTGLELLSPGGRRDALEREFQAVLADDLDGRVHSFDSPAAHAAGTIAAAQRHAGRTLEIRDAQIAGIAAARKAILATRNIRHFRELGVRLADPWGSGS